MGERGFSCFEVSGSFVGVCRLKSVFGGTVWQVSNGTLGDAISSVPVRLSDSRSGRLKFGKLSIARAFCPVKTWLYLSIVNVTVECLIML